MKYTVANSCWIYGCLILVLLVGAVWSSGTVMAYDAVGASMAGGYPESSRHDLPETDALILDIQKVLHDPEAFDPSWIEKLVSKLPAPVRKLGKYVWDGLKRILERLWEWLLSKFKPQGYKKQEWPNLLRLAYIPIIILTIGYFLFQILSRIKRDVRDGAQLKKNTEVGWQKLWREAWSRRCDDPREAIHDLIKAIIRRWVAEGRLPDDPTLTVREIERRATGRFLSEEEIKDFICLRYWYESVYFGGRQISSEDWAEILRRARRFLGEVPAV